MTEKRNSTVLGFMYEDRLVRRVYGFNYRIVIDASIPGAVISDDEMILVFDPAGAMMRFRNN